MVLFIIRAAEVLVDRLKCWLFLFNLVPISLPVY